MVSATSHYPKAGSTLLINRSGARARSTVGAGGKAKVYARSVDISIGVVKISLVSNSCTVTQLKFVNTCHREMS